MCVLLCSDVTPTWPLRCYEVMPNALKLNGKFIIQKSIPNNI
jgi:hypothetical protein